MTSQASKHPRFVVLFGFSLACSLLLFARSPGTGFVFDEQEAILANPYLRGGQPWLDALRVDFWGLPVARTIGSYRPLPNLLWRPLASTLSLGTPFFLQLLGPVLHALVASLVYTFLQRNSFALMPAPARSPWNEGRWAYGWPLPAESNAALRAARGSRQVGVAAGRPRLPDAGGAADTSVGGVSSAPFVGAGLLLTLGITTEAVVTVVGQADLLVAIWTLLGLLALELPLGSRMAAIFACGLLGLLSKETMLASFPLLLLGQTVLPGPGLGRSARGRGVLGVTFACVASVVALVLIRRHFFLGQVESAVPALTLPDSGVGVLLRLFEQPRLPIDPQNNPLSTAPAALRVPTALGIYASNLLQMFLPMQLSADYSFPREVPHGWTPRALVGALCLLVPLAYALYRSVRVLGLGSTRRAQDGSVGVAGLFVLGFAWTPLCYLPVSNLLVLLPTVRAERLLYVPAIGLCVLVAAIWPRIMHSRRAWQLLAFSVVTSAVQARAHALHYESDVLFWRATARGTPASAKAHLNLGVMLGARKDPAGRILATQRSVELSPNWPMAHVYLGDALCRAGRAAEATAHYVRGLELSPDQKDMAALALQCLWEAGAFEAARPALERAAAGDPQGWLAYLVGEVEAHGHENGGVPPAYRPRGYNRTNSSEAHWQ